MHSYMIFVFLWLTSLCITGCKLIHLIRTESNEFFYGWVIFHFMYVQEVLYPFICWWTSRLLPCPSYCKQCHSKQWGTCVFFIYGFLKVNSQEGKDCWLKEMGILDHLTYLLRNLYAGQEVKFRTGHVVTDWFQIRNGLR